MKKLTGLEIIKLINDGIKNAQNDEDEDYYFDDFFGDYLNKKEIFGENEQVEDVSETNGTAYRVYFFKDHDVYIRLNGYYCSYESYAKYGEDGEDVDFDVVYPFQKITTSYTTTKPE